MLKNSHRWDLVSLSFILNSIYSFSLTLILGYTLIRILHMGHLDSLVPWFQLDCRVSAELGIKMLEQHLLATKPGVVFYFHTAS